MIEMGDLSKVFGEVEREEDLYEPIRNALSARISDSYFEVTNRGFSNKLQREFDYETLYLINFEKFWPDITGYIKRDGSKEIVAVEVKKGDVKLKDVFQAKNYGEIFRSPHSLLISNEVMPEKLRRFLLKRRDLLQYFAGHHKLIIAEFDGHLGFDIDKKLYPTLPEPFALLRIRGRYI